MLDCKRAFRESNNYCIHFRCPCLKDKCRFYGTITHFDMLRRMTDREIAGFLAQKFTDHTTARMCEEGKSRTATSIAAEADSWFCCWLQWLRSSVCEAALEGWKNGEKAEHYTHNDVVYDILRNTPTVDAVEVVHGQWKTKFLVGGFAEEWGYVCSECGCTVSDRSNLSFGRFASNNQRLNYCPNCGAKMDGDGNG